MPNPQIGVVFRRGWWRSVIDGLRDAGPEYGALVCDLTHAVDNADSPYRMPLAQGGPVSSGRPYKFKDGDEFLAHTGPHAVKAEPHAVRQNDLVDALKQVAGKFPVHSEIHHALRLLGNAITGPPVYPLANMAEKYGQTPAEREAEKPKPVRCVCSSDNNNAPARLGHYGIGHRGNHHAPACPLYDRQHPSTAVQP